MPSSTFAWATGATNAATAPEAIRLDQPIPSPIVAHLPAPFLLMPDADAHETDDLPLDFPG
jgi:hypothetical protein